MLPEKPVDKPHADCPHMQFELRNVESEPARHRA